MPPPYHRPLTIAGQIYDFPHLEPFQLTVVSQKVGRPLRIHVRFTTHCFSENFDPAAHPQSVFTFPDAGRRPRVFSLVRYDLSKQLPGALQQLNHPKAQVRQTTQRRNWLHSIMVSSPAGPYHVFFELRRAPADERELQDLNLTVESAYPQDPTKPAPGVLGQIGFLLLAGKIYKGEPTATRR